MLGSLEDILGELQQHPKGKQLLLCEGILLKASPVSFSSASSLVYFVVIVDYMILLFFAFLWWWWWWWCWWFFSGLCEFLDSLLLLTDLEGLLKPWSAEMNDDIDSLASLITLLLSLFVSLIIFFFGSFAKSNKFDFGNLLIFSYGYSEGKDDFFLPSFFAIYKS